MSDRAKCVSTFSIVARDPEAEEWGVAVQSKFLAVGAVVPWARADVGAVATQAWANPSFGPGGLEYMSRGCSAREALDRLLAADPEREKRQVGLVDAEGRAATYTGGECHSWAGGVCGEGFAAQGNILVSEETVLALSAGFESSEGAPLADRLVRALDAGQRAGGDRRGRQSAALLVVKRGGGYDAGNDRYIDLRVDDHPDPIAELARLLSLHHLYFDKSAPDEMMPIDARLAGEIQEFLGLAGYYEGPASGAYDAATQRALWAYVGNENLEERWSDDALIDPVVLRFIREHREKMRG